MWNTILITVIIVLIFIISYDKYFQWQFRRYISKTYPDSVSKNKLKESIELHIKEASKYIVENSINYDRSYLLNDSTNAIMNNIYSEIVDKIEKNDKNLFRKLILTEYNKYKQQFKYDIKDIVSTEAENYYNNMSNNESFIDDVVNRINKKQLKKE